MSCTVGNLVRTILALGWQPLEPWRWATAEGDILDILSSSPYLVRSRVEQVALTKHSPHGHCALCRELLADRSATARLLGASRDESHPIALLSREQSGAAKAVLEGKPAQQPGKPRSTLEAATAPTVDTTGRKNSTDFALSCLPAHSGAARHDSR